MTKKIEVVIGDSGYCAAIPIEIDSNPRAREAVIEYLQYNGINHHTVKKAQEIAEAYLLESTTKCGLNFPTNRWDGILNEDDQ